MNWQDVCADSSLQDLPYKVELNRFGQIVMSPASNEHGYFQSEIVFELRSRLSEGRVITECSIDSPEGVKVADVAWCPASFVEEHGLTTPYPEAPLVCIEIVSPSNSKEEMELKAGLYTEAGAQEVWFCDGFGNLEFRKGTQVLKESELVPGFPSHVGV